MKNIKNWLKDNNITTTKIDDKVYYLLSDILRKIAPDGNRTVKHYADQQPDQSQLFKTTVQTRAGKREAWVITLEGATTLLYRCRVNPVMPQKTIAKYYVYFLVSKTHKYLKVGCSINPVYRLSQVTNLLPFADIEIYGIIDGDRHTEKATHADLAPHRIRGEWYHWNTETKKYIDSKLKPVQAA